MSLLLGGPKWFVLFGRREFTPRWFWRPYLFDRGDAPLRKDCALLGGVPWCVFRVPVFAARTGGGFGLPVFSFGRVELDSGPAGRDGICWVFIF